MKFRALSAALLAVAVAGSLAFAGDDAKKMDPKAKLEMMKAEMSKCMICKNMSAHIDELAPVMTMELVKMDNGMAMMHRISDPAKVGLYHTDHDAMSKAGAAAMTLTEEEAKTQLCSFCQEMRGVLKAGGQMSTGKTKDGDILVVSSSDVELQKKIAALHTHCEMMMAEM